MNALYVHTFPFCPLPFTFILFILFYFSKTKTDTAKRWLKAISLSEKQEFCNFVPPLTDETFEQFVQFFWLIKADDRPKANQLLSDIRRQWDIEGRVYPSTFNEFLASGDAAAFTGQVTRSTGKSVSKISAS